MNFFLYATKSLTPLLIAVALAWIVAKQGDGKGGDGIVYFLYSAAIVAAGVVASAVAAWWFFPK